MEKYDLIIIGAGPAGYEGAIHAAKNGLKTMVIEKAQTGGTCLNRGCIPAKTLLQCAHTYYNSLTSGKFGVSNEKTSYDIAWFYEYKKRVCLKLRDGVEQLLMLNGVVLCRGIARIISASEVEVTEDGKVSCYETRHILIATGSVPAVPSIPGAGLPGVFTSDGIFENAAVYNRIAIIGGGVIGMEFAEYFTALGKEVTIIEALDRILANMDKEISQSLSMILKKRGAKINTTSIVKKIKSGDALTVEFENKNMVQSVPCDAVLIAVGRRPVTKG
jgi:dihydrolipoamide dehydrogenase